MINPVCLWLLFHVNRDVHPLLISGKAPGTVPRKAMSVAVLADGGVLDNAGSILDISKYHFDM